MKPWLKLTLAVVALVIVIGGIKACQLQKMFAGFATHGEPSATVTATTVAYAEWNPTLNAVGSLRAVRGVELANEEAGLVQAVRFTSGQPVKAGQTLVELVSDADRARLASLQSNMELAKATHKRSKAQFAAEIISRAQLETDQAAMQAAVAAVQEQQALVNKKTIRAPFAGRTGITTLNPGQYLTPGSKVVTLQQLDPIYVDFTVPQNALGNLAEKQAVIVTGDNGVTLQGSISAIEPAVDTDTRNVRVQATLKNPDGKLLPGMFAKVQVSFGEPVRYLTLPQTAVSFNPYGETVFVVMDGKAYAAEQAAKQAQSSAAPAAALADPNAAPTKPRRVAKQVFITTGPARGDQIAVLTGIKEGDEVVTSGQLKLKNGLLLVVDNSVVPTNDPAPKPVDQ